jgi:hypothetical protein
MILLAAVGVVALINLVSRPAARIVIVLLMLTLTTDLGLQSISPGISSEVDFSNPYVYAHPTADVLKIEERIEQVSKADPAANQMTILVVCPQGDYWPLPWYLRSFKNVGFFNDVNEIKSPAPVVIASPQFEDRLISRLYDLSPPGQKNLYVPLFDTPVELRPGVELMGFITKDLLDESRKSNAGN